MRHSRAGSNLETKTPGSGQSPCTEVQGSCEWLESSQGHSVLRDSLSHSQSGLLALVVAGWLELLHAEMEDVPALHPPPPCGQGGGEGAGPVPAQGSPARMLAAPSPKGKPRAPRSRTEPHYSYVLGQEEFLPLNWLSQRSHLRILLMTLRQIFLGSAPVPTPPRGSGGCPSNPSITGTFRANLLSHPCSHYCLFFEM